MQLSSLLQAIALATATLAGNSLGAAKPDDAARGRALFDPHSVKFTIVFQPLFLLSVNFVAAT